MALGARNCGKQTLEWGDIPILYYSVSAVDIFNLTRMDVKGKNYSCDRCGLKVGHKRSLLRHIKNIHESDVDRGKKVYKCQELEGCTYRTNHIANYRKHIQSRHRMRRLKKCLYCDFKTVNTELLRRHKLEHNNECLARYHCSVCKLVFSDSESFENHLNERHPKSNDFELIQQAFSKKLRVYGRNIREKGADTQCLKDVFKDFKLLCRRISAEEFPVFRLNVCMIGIFEKSSPDGNEEEKETDTFLLKSTHFTVKPHSRLKNIWTAVMNQFDDRIENLLMKGSGYSLTEVLKLHIEISSKPPLRYSCQDKEFRPEIATENIYGKKHLFNVDSDYNCFLSCLGHHVGKLTFTEPDAMEVEVDSENHFRFDDFLNSLDFTGTGINPPYQEPIGINQIKRLLKANKKLLGDLQVNIFGLYSIEKQEIYAYETGIGKRETDNVLNLLSIPVHKNYLLKEKKKVKTQQHLVIIKDLNAFMKQKTGKSRTSRKLCLKCLNYFKNDFYLKKHKLSCNNPRGQVEAMPEEGEKIEFNSWHKKSPAEVVGFLDFETVQVNDEENPEVKTLKAYQYSLVFVDKFDKLLFEKREFSEEGKAGDMCLETLLQIEQRLFSHARRSKEMKMTKSDWIKSREAKTCHICEQDFYESEEKVRDHCHYSSKFLG